VNNGERDARRLLIAQKVDVSGLRIELKIGYASRRERPRANMAVPLDANSTADVAVFILRIDLFVE